MSAYNDLRSMTSSKDIALHYFSNYLHTHVGSYPFDVEMGCLLKQQLQGKDISFKRILITNEVNLIANVMARDYQINVQIKNIDILPQEFYDYTDYFIELTLSVEGEIVSITV